ncbi:cytochrome-c peroxidase [Massilia sp. YIM B04103]|uniref:cytochrome-c peroxidase n=1 Tax=Massilia sp. YIM B04103 TaxID=2963106 RepID=UPI00210A293A|nr:cytochrome c peroxidase [Massilia sp. YIM B04103]
MQREIWRRLRRNLRTLSLGGLLAAGSAMPALLAGENGTHPSGLPPLSAASSDNPARIALGKTLFYDKRLSGNGQISCASCHQPERAFSDGEALAKGIGGRSGTRNAPSILNAAYNASQFWEGRQPTLEAQALDPFTNAREHGLASEDALLAIVRADPAYLSQFRLAFGATPQSITASQVAQAIASFERTLIAGNSPFDRYYYRGEQAALNAAARRGLALFQGAAKCASCHRIERNSALFSDDDFHSLSVGLQRIAPQLPALTTRLVRLRAQSEKLGDHVLSEEDVAELGRFALTLKPADIGKFRTPSLRNVALTAPYMHDGSVATLEEAVELEIYYRSAEAGYPLILTPAEKQDLVAFLKALNSPEASQPPAHWR